MANYDELDADALRLEVAKRKGYTNVSRYATKWQHYDVLDGLQGKQPDGIFTTHVPNWSTSIADAWELREETRTDGFLFVVKHWSDLDKWKKPPLWKGIVGIVSVELVRGDVFGEDLYFSAHGVNESEAACRVWLMWDDERGEK